MSALETLSESTRTSRVTRRRIDSRINLLGLGGVGSNLAGLLSNFSSFSEGSFQPKAFLFDFDHVELHNLNRTPFFRLSDAFSGTLKTKALNSLLDCARFSFSEDRITEEDEARLMSSYTVIDCRDTLEPSAILKQTWIKLAYDGGNEMAFHFNPKEYCVGFFSLGGSYDVVPSFYVTANMLGTISIFLNSFRSLALNIKPQEVQFKLDETILSSIIDPNELNELFEKQNK